LQGRGTSAAGGGVFRQLTGTLATCFDDIRDYVFDIVPHIGGSDPDRVDSATAKPHVSSRVALGVAAEFMNQAVDLDGNARLVTKKSR
jgi:hypothetical protein